MKYIAFVFLFLSMSIGTESFIQAEHSFSGTYTDRNLSYIAFPIGGFGSGMYCLEGNGALSHFSVDHRMDFFNEPSLFAAVSVQDKTKDKRQAHVLEGPVPDYKYFSRPNSGLGSRGRTYGLPRYTKCIFKSRFPFCDIQLTDPLMPLQVEITGFSPFIPHESDLSSWPAGSIDYTFTNTKTEPLDAVFSFNSVNFMKGDRFDSIKNGFRVVGPKGEFAFVVAEPDKAHVDCCWFRGNWFDALTVVWNNIQQGKIIDNPPVKQNAPGASLFVPFRLNPNEKKTIRLYTIWYVPRSDLNISSEQNTGILLSEKPAPGTATVQSKVSGYLGKGLVNTYYPNGDAHLGTILSPDIKVTKKYLHFLVGGGNGTNVGISLLDKGKEKSSTVKRISTARGTNSEELFRHSWDLSALQGHTIQIEIFDRETGPWGHINADQFVLSDFPLDKSANENELSITKSTDTQITKSKAVNTELLADFESDTYGTWRVVQDQRIIAANNAAKKVETYTPWYSTRFKSLDDLLAAFDMQYKELRRRSELFASTWHRSTLPSEIMEAVEANLTILKSPTILRQQDGRLWGWEGNDDQGGSCAGTCTHVWNYAQSIAHLFPDLERSLRQTEFHESLTSEGRQAFRANLPIAPGGLAWNACDGQLGSIMRLHREWRISGSKDWLKEYWPLAKRSIDFSIDIWDPEETGLPVESHHNTYDINYLGPEGHCGSFYLGALAAMIKMGNALGEDVSRYQTLLSKGQKRMETELFNGEYFIQKIPGPGKEARPEIQSEYYREIARQVDEQGPKYQYGNGCLSDGVLGFWMAKVCGIDDELVDPKLIRSHLLSVYKYNFKQDLSQHSNPQRPSYAFGREGGLLLCTWPKNDKPLLPFVYSDEVWTGIEYQVASHLMLIGEIEKGCDIVRACRERYNGIRRNPYNEYECGHWYARAMSSFALLQGATGVRYDAVEKKLLYNESVQNWTVPLFTETGYGLVHYRHENGKKGSVTLEVIEGVIPLNDKK